MRGLRFATSSQYCYNDGESNTEEDGNHMEAGLRTGSSEVDCRKPTYGATLAPPYVL